MGRPKCKYNIGFSSDITNFKPIGGKKNPCESVCLTPEEGEALRLKHIKGLEQIECAKCMGISRSTFQRILTGAHKKLAEAIVGGKTIEMIGKKLRKNK